MVSSGQFPGEKGVPDPARRPYLETAREAGRLLFAQGSGENRESLSRNRGVGIIFHIVPIDQFMFYVRDDKPDIPFPGMVDTIGGNIEEGETPEQALLREIGEELTDTDTGKPFRPGEIKHFKTFADHATGEHNIFSSELYSIPNLKLNEGQRLVFLTREEVRETNFAHGFNEIVREYLEASDL